MKKYHISDHGEIVECKAQRTPCPKQNFNNMKEAEKFLHNTYKSSVMNTRKKSVKNKDVLSAEKYYGGKFVRPYSINVPKGVEKALDDISAIGNPLIVGGAVRDSFENHLNKDIDIEVHHTDIDTLTHHLKNQGYIVDEVGKQFGVLKVQKKGVVHDLDVSVPRRENRSGAGHRAFNVSMDKDMNVVDAAERRDFTFNAVMYDHKRKMLVDPMNGEQDYRNRIMRHVSEKFAEDPLRVLRGFQFAGRFNLSYDPTTAELCRSLRKEYTSLSQERVQEEWQKFFTKSSSYEAGIKALQESGWDDTIPGLQQSLNNPHTIESLNTLNKYSQSSKKVVYGPAIIAYYAEKEKRSQLIQKISIGKDQQNLIHSLINTDADTLQTSYDRKNYIRKMSKHGFNFQKYQEFSELINDKKGYEVASAAIQEGIGENPEKDLVMGKDILMMTDRKPGPWISELLNSIRNKQYKNEFNNKDDALAEAQRLIYG